jgi:hypothetical protein
LLLVACRSFGRAGGIPRRLCPILVGLREEVVDGKYTLVSSLLMLYCRRRAAADVLP